jgi:hypothetical protein
VHGAWGSSQGTWTYDNDPTTFWPLEWLPNDVAFRDTGIYTFGFSTDLALSNLEKIEGPALSLLQCIGYHKDLKNNDKVSSGLPRSRGVLLIAFVSAATFLRMPRHGRAGRQISFHPFATIIFHPYTISTVFAPGVVSSRYTISCHVPLSV